MSALTPHLPILQVLVPLISALLVAFLRDGRVAWVAAVAACWATFGITLLLMSQVLAQEAAISYVFGPWTVPFGIEYRVDRLSIFVLLIVSGMAAVIVPYAGRSAAREIAPAQQAWFYSMLLLAVTGLLGITVTGDAFNVFVFLEISSLSAYVLIAMGQNRRALLAAYQYLIVGTIGATFYVIGIGLLYLATGSLNMLDIASKLDLAQVQYARPVLAALAFLTVGICLKLALFPLHLWLPNAYAYAPSPVAAFLAATATKVAVYLLIRIYYTIYGPVFGADGLPVDEVLLVLSLSAMLIASASAMSEQNIKRRMAYSSVAQIGYITLGVALVNVPGLTGGIVHLFNHAIMKACLFMALGAVFYRTGSVRLEDMAGIGRRMPLTMGAFVVAGLGLIGVPGTAGFVSKWYLAVGAVERGLWPVLFVIMASSLLAVVYVGRVIEVAYFREPAGAVLEARDPPLAMLVPMLVLAVAVVWFGLDTRLSVGMAAEAAARLIGGLK